MRVGLRLKLVEGWIENGGNLAQRCKIGIFVLALKVKGYRPCSGPQQAMGDGVAFFIYGSGPRQSIVGQMIVAVWTRSKIARRFLHRAFFPCGMRLEDQLGAFLQWKMVLASISQPTVVDKNSSMISSALTGRDTALTLTLSKMSGVL